MTHEINFHFIHMELSSLFSDLLPRLVMHIIHNSKMCELLEQCRREQIAELTRLGQTLMHVRQLFWIVADDRDSCNPMLGHILDNFGEYETPRWSLQVVSGVSGFNM